MGPYNTLARNLLLPIGDIFLGTSLSRHMKLFNKSQMWSYEQLEEYQNRKIRQLIIHAYNNVPFYHNLFRNLELYPEDIKSPEDLKKLPILTKEEIKKNFPDFLATNIKELGPIPRRTGGTTGKPFRYYLDRDSLSASWAVTFRGWNWSGYKYGDKIVTIAGSSLVPDKKAPLKKRIRSFMERNHGFSGAHLSNEIMAGYTKKIQKINPEFLRGYPSSIFSFARFVKKKNIRNINLRAVFVTAEVLYPHQREFIESTFGCPVFNHYGCGDGGANANECEEHTGHHISSDRAIMEFVDQENKEEWVSPEERGEIILTDLFNYAMPFIRYSPADIGVLSAEKCPCGRCLPLLKDIEGRTTDIIEFSNGISLSGPAFTLVFKDFNLDHYQLIQKTRDKLLIRLVKDENYSEAESKRILEIMRYHCGEGVELKLEFVEGISTTKNSKFKFIISEI